MAVIEVYNGHSGYRDESAIRDVVNYAVGSRYQRDYRCYGIINIPEPEYAVNAFENIQRRYDYKDRVRLHHIVISPREKELDMIEISDLSKLVTDYWGMENVQCIAVVHYGSAKNIYHPHLHVIINHVKLDGKKFHGSNDSYYELAKYLKKNTGFSFSVYCKK